MMVDDDSFDAAMASLAVPVRERPAVLGPVVGQLTATRARVVGCVVWGLAVVVGAAMTATTTVVARTATGPVTAHCGLDVFVYGQPDRAVASACRHAEAGRALVWVPAMLIVLGGLVFVALLREGFRAVLRGAPVHTALIGLGGAAAIVGGFALRPASTDISGSAGISAVHCGVDTYLFGHADPQISTACGHAFAPHAHVLIGAVVVVIVGALAAAHLLVRRGGTMAARRLGAVGLVVAIAAVVIGALRPVSVAVPEGGGTVVASCGLDSYVAGYPDAAVQSACRSHLHAHVAAAGGVLMLGLVALGGATLLRRQREAQRESLAVRTEP